MTSDSKTELPWAHLPTIKIQMIENDVWGFGPTILEKGKTYVLPELDARYFIGNETAVTEKEDDKQEI